MANLFASADCIVSNHPSNVASESKSVLKNSDDKDGQVRAPLLGSRRSTVKSDLPAPTASISQVVEPTIASDEFDKVFKMVE